MQPTKLMTFAGIALLLCVAPAFAGESPIVAASIPDPTGFAMLLGGAILLIVGFGKRLPVR
jgi:hypothetical protein